MGRSEGGGQGAAVADQRLFACPRGVVVTEAGSCLRLIDSCITQLQAPGPSRTFHESKKKKGFCLLRASGLQGYLAHVALARGYLAHVALAQGCLAHMALGAPHGPSTTFIRKCPPRGPPEGPGICQL